MSRGPFGRALRSHLLGIALLALSGPAARTARAAPPAVAVGEVVVALDATQLEGTRGLERALRSALATELAQLGRRGVVVDHPLVVSATLTKLSSERHKQHTTASAAISLALRRADDQVLFAELRGRASAEEAAGNLASVRSAALRAAVRGAVERLPEALRRAR